LNYTVRRTGAFKCEISKLRKIVLSDISAYKYVHFSSTQFADGSDWLNAARYNRTPWLLLCVLFNIAFAAVSKSFARWQRCLIVGSCQSNSLAFAHYKRQTYPNTSFRLVRKFLFRLVKCQHLRVNKRYSKSDRKKNNDSLTVGCETCE